MITKNAEKVITKNALKHLNATPPPPEFTTEELELLLQNLNSYTPEEQTEIYKIVEELEARKRAEACHSDLIEFCKAMQPDYKVGKHHRILANLLMEIEKGKIHDKNGKETKRSGKDRVCVNMPPRHGKSQLISIYFPAWFLGRNPDKKVLMVSHTTDLAVDFGRKVRNLIGTEQYQAIFPNVQLAQDSKSAGRWNTNLGGEYFACLRRYALVRTDRGLVPASQVRVGDRLINTDGYVTVQEVYDSQHNTTYTVAGLSCSAKHPIWTMGRGWVHAKDLTPTDVLCVESISDIMKALFGRVYGYLEHTYVSPLVQHKESLHQPQQREVGVVRWAWNHLGRAMADLRELCAGHGAAANPTAYSGENGQQRPLRPGELPVGGRPSTAKQQAQQPGLGWAYVGAAFAGYGADSGSNSVPVQGGDTAGVIAAAEEELRAYSNPSNLGWVRRTAARFLTRSSQSDKPGHSGSSTQGYMARTRGAAQKLCGFLLGVRRVGHIEVIEHDTPHPFVNFLTDGNHTFFVDGVLTHNCGVGSALAGRGAHLLLIDDPHNEQDIINGNLGVFDKAYEWFTYGARTRLMPGGRVAIVQCMTGDTGVLLPNGTEKPLRDIRPGDSVASYKDGRLVARKVLNKQSNGLDDVFTIKTTSHNMGKANRRHPFLVQTSEGLEWRRVQNLRAGDTLVSLKGAYDWVGPKQNPVNAKRVSQKTATTEKIHVPRTYLSGITASIKAFSAKLMGAMNPLTVTTSAALVTGSSVGPMGTTDVAQSKTETLTYGTGTESALMSTILCWLNKTADAQFVGSLRQSITPEHTGTVSYVSITATIQDGLEHFSATTVTLPLDIPNPEKQLSPLPSISDFTLTTITAVEYAGREEVFDIEVEETENFIANSIVSHNTRWHMDDLTGRVVRDMAQSDLADKYEVVEFPAILEVEREVEDPDNPTKTIKMLVEKPLWPEFFNLEALHRTKASMPLFQWNAQYQQKPTAEEAAIVKREWWKEWTQESPPKCEYIIMSLDAAAETNNRADYTALTTWGVFFNEQENRYSVILLNSIKRRLEFPELKDLAYSEFKQWEPDAFIVEKKGSGTPLYQEMRRMGLVIQEYTPHRGSGDKIARLNSVADIVSSGLVWVPQTRWAEELIEEVAGFPFMSHDDLVDSTIMALMRFRQGGFLRLPSDEKEVEKFFSRRKGGYY